MPRIMKFWADCTLDQKIERWEQAARVLRELTPHEKNKHFNMDFWAKSTPCGMVACAAGHCAMDAWFKRRKFKLIQSEVEPDVFFCLPRNFFGFEGSNQIFYNYRKRSVSKVILEIENYIRFLKICGFGYFSTSTHYRPRRANVPN